MEFFFFGERVADLHKAATSVYFKECELSAGVSTVHSHTCG